MRDIRELDKASKKRVEQLDYKVGMFAIGHHIGAPCLRCGKDILRLHDQVAAVCLMKQAALDFHEICCQVAKFAVILYLKLPGL